MKRLGRWSLNFMARALEPVERDVVLGDLAESGEGFCAATRDLLGLIVRRQAGLWMSWRPWLALFGVGWLAGVPLSRIAYGLDENLHQYAADYYTDLTAGQEVAFLLGLAGALLVWSWACGFVVGSLSGRAVWVTWSVFYVVVLDSVLGRFVPGGMLILRDSQAHATLLSSLQPALRLLMVAMLPRSIATLLFTAPALVGALVGVRRRALRVNQAYLIALVGAALVVLMTWATGVHDAAHLPARWPKDPWPTRLLPFLWASWPAAYLLVTARRQLSEKEEVG